MPDSTYHQIHFAWAGPTLLGRVGPGPDASSLPESEQPVLRSWRDRLIPALTADYRSALPGRDPADYPETLWARAYPDGQAALVYRWPGDVRSAHAWAIVGPARGLTLARVLSLHENPNTRPAERRPPAPGWATMSTLPVPQPWELAATPGAVRTRDRRAAETIVEGEPVLVGAVAAALHRPDLPIHIALAPERADLWQAVQMRFLWGMHRVLHDVLTPPRAIPAAGWSWSFSTYDPVLGAADGQHLAFGTPPSDAPGPFLSPLPPDHRKVAEGLVAVLREEGGDALAAHLDERGVAEAPTFADRRDLLRDWLDPRPRSAAPAFGPSPIAPADVPVAERLPEEDPPTAVESLPELPEVEEPGEEETGPQLRFEPRALLGRPDAAGTLAGAVPGVPRGQRSLKGITEEGSAAFPAEAERREGDGGPQGSSGEGDPAPYAGSGTHQDSGGQEAHAAHEGGRVQQGGEKHGDNEALWPEADPEPEPLLEVPEPEGSGPLPEPGRPRIAPAHEERTGAGLEDPTAPSGIFGSPEPHGLWDSRRPRIVSGPSVSPDQLSETEEAEARASGAAEGEWGVSPTFERWGRASARAFSEAPPTPAQDTFGTGGPADLDEGSALPPETLQHQDPHQPQDEWSIAASPEASVPPPPPTGPMGLTTQADQTAQEASTPEPRQGPELTDGPEDRTPADAPPLPLLPGTDPSPDPSPDTDTGPEGEPEAPLDYAAETEPDPAEFSAEADPDDNWPTQYADLPLSRLERWHSRHGPEGAHADIVDARAAVRAERAELQRVRGERDHYHAEVQELRREVARLDRPWLEGPDEDGEAPEARRPRRWPSRVLALILLAALLATGLEAGARFGLGATDILGLP